MDLQYQSFISESLTRFQNGNFLTGDLVKFNKKAFSGEWAKTQSPEKLAKLKAMNDSGDYLRVGYTKTLRPSVTYSNEVNVDGFYVDVTRELAPGMYTDVVTVPGEVLDLISKGGEDAFQTPPNEKNKRKGKIDIKPVNIDAKDSKESAKTGLGDVAAGTEMKKQTGVEMGDKSLPTADTKQKFVSKSPSNVASYMSGW